MTTIYHNPRCSKSRATLALIREKGIEPKVVLYLEDPPDIDTLRSITEKLGCSAIDITRTGDQQYRDLNIAERTITEGSTIELLADFPALLERPIVLHNNKAVVGRPPENVLTIL